jgi:hypothetical protein
LRGGHNERPKGLSYVPQIKAAYAELTATNESKLKCALKLGGLLNDAKEAVGKDRQWMKFRETYFPEISHSTANVYMNLAKNKAKFDDPVNSQRSVNSMVEKDLSIRGAIEALKSDEEKAAAEKKRAAKRAEREVRKAAEAAGQKSQDLAVILEDKAPDELLDAIEDKEKKDELLKQQLKNQDPLILADVLLEIWEVEQLRLFGEHLAVHVKRKMAEAEDGDDSKVESPASRNRRALLQTEGRPAA